MYLLPLTALTMTAFAANSVLTRMAIDGQHIDPSGFALVRVATGALVLGMLITLRGGGLPLLRLRRVPGALSLAAYMIGFSLAYLTLDAGLGALILFGVVQITMFCFSALQDTAPTRRQMTGATVAFVGLMVALWPGAGGTGSIAGALLMVIAGLGWAAYTIIGRRAADPLAATAANFLLCLPVMLILLIGTDLYFSATGLALGMLCGGLTSGLGYALWYSVLPRLDAATAATVQLSVPLLAILGGVVFLDEPVGIGLAVATLLVIGGIGWGVSARSVQAGRR